MLDRVFDNFYGFFASILIPLNSKFYCYSIFSFLNLNSFN